MRERLSPGAAVLDVGGGSDPTFPRARDLNLSEYVGLDLSAQELRTAPADVYTSVVTGDVGNHREDLDSRFDLIVSWQVFEHVADLARTIANCHSYLRPGGSLVAVLSGRHSLPAILNRAVPHSLAKRVNAWLLGRDPASMFPAPYDNCTGSGLVRSFADWDELMIEPRYEAAVYLLFSRQALRLYTQLENAAVASSRANLASHYFVAAKRS